MTFGDYPKDGKDPLNPKLLMTPIGDKVVATAASGSESNTTRI